MARIALVEDDAGYRRTVEDVLVWVGGHEVVASFGTGRTAIADTARRRQLGDRAPWDLLITDLEMPEVDGLQTTSAHKELLPDVPVMVLTVHEDPPTIVEAIARGADGYLLKSAGPEELLDAVRVALSGGSPLTPAVARHLLTTFRQRFEPAGRAMEPDRTLTPRERDVLRGLVQGQAYKEVADGLGVSLDTVRHHIRGLYKKLRVQNAGGAVAAALRDGLV